jgi:hypothetical protein
MDSSKQVASISPLSLQMLVSTRNLENLNFVLNQITKSSVGIDAHRGRGRGGNDHLIEFHLTFSVDRNFLLI